MLVISRKEKERIRLYDRDSGLVIWLTVTLIDGNKVRIGTDAPRCVEVMREELLPREERHGGR